MITVLRGENVGEQSRAGQAALDRTRLGAGACTITSQPVQLSLGRTWRITLKLAGMYSRISETSSPSFRSVPPHSGQACCAGSCVLISRGR